MPTAPALPLTNRLEFGPPPNKRAWGALVLALLAHVLLVVALTWGVNWKNSDEAAAFSAELWTGQPQQQVSVQTPPEPPTPVPTPPAPSPEPAATAKVEEPTPDADIALEQEKKRARLRKQQDAEKAQELAEEKAADLAAKKLAKLKDDQARLKKEQAEEQAKALAAEKADAAQQKAQKLAQAAKDKTAKAEKQKQEADQRKAQLARMQAMLGSAGATASTGATGGGNPRGTAAQGSGSSSTYWAIIKAAVKPNVVFTEEVVGNPTAKVEVRLTLDGTIISQRLLSSSGNKAWDDAAMNGITRTRVMPRDVDGRIPDTTLILEMRPKN